MISTNFFPLLHVFYRIISIDLYGEEYLWEEPEIPPKKRRTRNIVAVAVWLDWEDKKVRLYSNSRAVVDLAKLQNSENIDAVYVASETHR